MTWDDGGIADSNPLRYCGGMSRMDRSSRDSGRLGMGSGLVQLKTANSIQNAWEEARDDPQVPDSAVSIMTWGSRHDLFMTGTLKGRDEKMHISFARPLTRT